METFREEQKQVKHMFRSARMSNNVEMCFSASLPDNLVFPLTTMEELESLEIKLASSSVELNVVCIMNTSSQVKNFYPLYYHYYLFYLIRNELSLLLW